MNYTILSILLLLNFLLPSCTSNCCLNESEFETIPGLQLYEDVLYFKGDSIELRTFILDQIESIDSTDWKHNIVYLKIADELEKRSTLSETSQALRYKVITANIGNLYYLFINDEKITEEFSAKLYLLSYANFRYANTMYNRGNTSQSLIYFNFAYEYSPDRLTEYSCENLANYFNSNLEFRSIYAEKLEEVGDIEKAWNIWFELANDNDTYIKYLELLHSKLYPDEDFEEFWDENRFSHFPVINNFKFVDSAGDTILIHNLSEDWMMIDFWHTQCGGCIREFPKIEKFNTDVVANHSANNQVVAINLGGDVERMRDVIEQKNYQFVIGTLINYKPESGSSLPRTAVFPYKIIVTPENKYFIIPSVFWKEYSKKYLLSNR